jgi:hypothetical protein
VQEIDRLYAQPAVVDTPMPQRSLPRRLPVPAASTPLSADTAAAASAAVGGGGPVSENESDSTAALETPSAAPEDDTVPAQGSVEEVMNRELDMLADNLVDRSPVAMSRYTPVPRLHMMFVMLGLKHVFITDGGRLVGAVWREDMVEGSAL